MIRLYAYLMGFCLLATSSSAPAFEASLFDELQIIFPDTPVSEGSNTLMMDTAYGTDAAVHILVTGLEGGTNVDLTVQERGKDVSEIRRYRILPVHTGHNTGLYQKVETRDKRNPYVIRDAPFSVFEILEPCSDNVAVPEGIMIMSFRVELPVEHVATYEKRLYSIHVKADGKNVDLKWEVGVHPVAVTPRRKSRHAYTNWFCTWKLGKNYPELQKDKASFDALIDEYNRFVLRSRQTMQLTYIPAKMKDGHVSFNHQEFDERLQYNRTHGLRTEIAHLCGGGWGDPKMTLRINWKDISEPGQKEILRELLAEIRNGLKRNKVDDAVIHIRDEVVDKGASGYKIIADMIHREVPGLKVIDAVNCNPATLEGFVDIWVPLPRGILKHREFFNRRKAAGDEVWYYVCHNPGGKWINRMLDQERLRQVYLGWALAYYDLDGFLHWGFNYGGRDVAENASYGGELPPGDAHLVYPTPKGACSSQRLEAMRIGMEDADLLERLKEKDPRQAAAVMKAVFRGFKDYSVNVSDYRAAKHSLLKALY